MRAETERFGSLSQAEERIRQPLLGELERLQTRFNDLDTRYQTLLEQYKALERRYEDLGRKYQALSNETSDQTRTLERIERNTQHDA